MAINGYLVKQTWVLSVCLCYIVKYYVNTRFKHFTKPSLTGPFKKQDNNQFEEFEPVLRSFDKQNRAGCM